ncbi:MAG: sn-glycerol-3-phosphate ABC transporter ATP-binding protein UgpC [Fusobacteria bacterium]|nr:sn-glycerol-3-phosphate ABC transporter ATP-binding protein UgpC [Fusobacteriota bacterium]
MASVNLKKISKKYPNGFEAVHGIDLDINDGEFMVLVGPSGCAKSTTLRMVAGLEEISGGELKIDDKIMNDVAPKDRGIAMVFQNYALYPHMSVYENMAFALKLAKFPKAEIEKRVKDAAEKLEITDLLERKPKDMSGGQRQRVAIGRAIVRYPKVFLFDEPLSNLDAKLRVSMRVRIKQLQQQLKAEGKDSTMIYVTHDQVEAMTMGDRICVMKLGHIMQVDEPLNLYKYPKNKFVAGFIGSPAMNIVKATMKVRGSDVDAVIGKLSFKLTSEKINLLKAKVGELESLNGKEVWFGIRPEHISAKSLSGGHGNHEGSVTTVEEMGNEKYIYFDLEGFQMTSRVRSHETNEKITLNGVANFEFDMIECHIFDSVSEENISI